MSQAFLRKPASIKTSEPFNIIFPIKPHILASVTESMGRDGFDSAEPLVAWNGIIVDGHTRLEAALDAGIELIPVVEKEFQDEDAALEYAIKRQKDRRNLTDEDILRCIETLDSRKRKSNNLNIGPEASCEASGNSLGKTAAKTADLLGTSRAKVERARAVLDHATPESKKQVLAGEKSINAAYNETKGPTPVKVKLSDDTNALTAQISELEALLAEEREEHRETARMLAETMDECASMARVFESEDQITAALGEAKRFRELARVTQVRLDGSMGENHSLAQAAKRWMGKFERLEKKVKASGILDLGADDAA